MDDRLLPAKIRIYNGQSTLYEGPLVTEYPRVAGEFWVLYSFTDTNIREEFDNDRDAIYDALEDVSNNFENATSDEVIVDEGGTYIDAVSLAVSVNAGANYIAFAGNDIFQPITLRFT